MARRTASSFSSMVPSWSLAYCVIRRRRVALSSAAFLTLAARKAEARLLVPVGLNGFWRSLGRGMVAPEEIPNRDLTHPWVEGKAHRALQFTEAP
jgi:hypothetical protein